MDRQSFHPLRDELERAMRQALATFPAQPSRRTAYLVASLVALLDLDVTLANRFLGPSDGA